MTTRWNNPVEYLYPAVRQRVDRAVNQLSSSRSVQAAVRTLVALAPDEPAMLSLPLLVHAAEAGDPEPAVPVAAVHYLWWTAAHVFDDVIDHASTAYSPDITAEESVMAAVVCGTVLPMSIVVSDLPSTILPGAVDDFCTAWVGSNDGQIRDLSGVPGRTSSHEVLHTYRCKNGAPYGMACSMAARLSGTDDQQVARWQEFGVMLGWLGQFRNDQEDLASGRDEDLKNRTATFLISHLFEQVTEEADRTRLTKLIEAAPVSIVARERLRRHLLDGDHVESYLTRIAEVRRMVDESLDATERTGRYVQALRHFVQQSGESVVTFGEDCTAAV